MLPLGLFLVTLFIVWHVFKEIVGASGHSFFRICTTTADAQCTAFTWLHLALFCVLCLSTAVLLGVTGIRKWRASRPQ